MKRSAVKVTVQVLLLVAAAAPRAASAQRELHAPSRVSETMSHTRADSQAVQDRPVERFADCLRVDTFCGHSDRSAQVAQTPCCRGADATSVQVKSMIVRISEIEVDPNYLDEYKSILKEEAAASVKLEPGVISIFPMYEKEGRTQFRILEIYASREAYESHLITPHFQRYKTTTLNMVKSLRLVDMGVLDTATMVRIFDKMECNK